MDDPEIEPSAPNSGRGTDLYIPGHCNIDRKGRWIRGAGAFLGLVLVVFYNETWRTFLVHPLLYVSGLLLLSTLTALSLIQSMMSFCVMDAFLGRTFLTGGAAGPIPTSPANRRLDRRRAFVLFGGALLAGALFSAVLLVSELNQIR